MKPQTTVRTLFPQGLLALLSLTLLCLPAVPSRTAAASTELNNTEWSIILDDFGYSDLALDQRPGFEGREYLSGEWAAAIAYSRGSASYGPTWLNPDFMYPDWQTGSDFTTESELTLLPGVNAYGFLVAQSVIRNSSVRVTITSEMIDTTNGIPEGLTPRSGSAPASRQSSRYVFRQSYQVDNFSGQTLSGVRFFKFLHSLQASQAVFDDRSYGATYGGHHYTITQQGTDFGIDSLTSLGVTHFDTVALHANLAPSAWEVGRYGIEGIDDHAGTNKPSVGVHLSVEAGHLSGRDSFGPTNLWVSGALQCDLGTLAPGRSTNIEFLLSLGTVTAAKDLQVVAWGSALAEPDHIPAAASNLIAVAAGANHSLALRRDGRVVAWGLNSSGQASVPDTLSNVVQVAAGAKHSLALRNDGKVIGWGDNTSGQISVPLDLPSVSSIAAGANHSLALLRSGAVVGWGDNSFGQIDIPPLSSVTRLAAGSNFSLALLQTGSIAGWGDGSLGQLDIPSSLMLPVEIAAGASHALALDYDGSIAAWGDNSEGQTDIPYLENVNAIAAGASHCLALLGDGSVVTWGSNSQGQTNTPAGLSQVAGIAAGEGHSLAIVPVPPALLLSATPQNLTLSWSAAWAPGLENVVLEETTGLAAGSWTPVNLPGQFDQGRYSVVIPVNSAKKFYRLRIEML